MREISSTYFLNIRKERFLMERVVIEIEHIPYFLELYLDKQPELEPLIHLFCKYIIDTKPNRVIKDITPHKTKENQSITLIEIEYEIENEEIQRFCDFYCRKSKLDFRLDCKYESELGICKTLENDCFQITVRDGSIYRNGFFYLDIMEKNSDYKQCFRLKEILL